MGPVPMSGCPLEYKQDHKEDSHDRRTYRQTKNGPFFTCNVQFTCGNNIRDISWNEHTTGDEKTEQDRTTVSPSMAGLTSAAARVALSNTAEIILIQYKSSGLRPMTYSVMNGSNPCPRNVKPITNK